MFTNEIEFDSMVTTIMDESGQEEDVQIVYTDNDVYIRQYNNETKAFDLIQMSVLMYADLMESFRKGEGLFQIKMK